MPSSAIGLQTSSVLFRSNPLHSDTPQDSVHPLVDNPSASIPIQSILSAPGQAYKNVQITRTGTTPDGRPSFQVTDNDSSPPVVRNFALKVNNARPNSEPSEAAIVAAAAIVVAAGRTDPPIAWKRISLAAGQEPKVYGNSGNLLATNSSSLVLSQSARLSSPAAPVSNFAAEIATILAEIKDFKWEALEITGVPRKPVATALSHREDTQPDPLPAGFDYFDDSDWTHLHHLEEPEIPGALSVSSRRPDSRPPNGLLRSIRDAWEDYLLPESGSLDQHETAISLVDSDEAIEGAASSGSSRWFPTIDLEALEQRMLRWRYGDDLELVNQLEGYASSMPIEQPKDVVNPLLSREQQWSLILSDVSALSVGSEAGAAKKSKSHLGDIAAACTEWGAALSTRWQRPAARAERTGVEDRSLSRETSTHQVPAWLEGEDDGEFIRSKEMASRPPRLDDSTGYGGL